MDAVPHSNSSNVTVEYTDPFGLFPAIKPLLLEAHQLRNLHWKSPSRPLRSIGCLQIDFVPAHSPEEQKRLSDGPGGAIAHRRHQIPGLRRTPYLKVYLLRCDDNETYKATSRKLVREWVKTTGSGSGDNHNACEWLIIHAVDANAPSSDAPEKSGPMAKWPGRGSTSVLEKLRADFNGSSKSAVDRVVQLRILEKDTTQRELAIQVEDLVTKLKSSILTSFDLRVAQYEEDIREKDSQRRLPGWNFCTFFMLKEGLAMGFENVGLYEDALISYDELSAGLDAVLREQWVDGGDQHGGTFLPCSAEMKSRAEAALSSFNDSSDTVSNNDEALQGQENTTHSDPVGLDSEHYPFNPHKQPYREMIVANNISVFDFRIYIFSRQIQLLLRASQAPSQREKRTQHKEAHDLTLLAEICDRACEFIALASRVLRGDLQRGISKIEPEPENSMVTEVIDNLVLSWSYAAVSQVLNQTAIDSLKISNISISSPKDLVDASILTSFSDNSSKDVLRRPSAPAQIPTSHPSPFEPQLTPFTNSSVKRRTLLNLLPETTAKDTGAIELASARADLYLYARRILENLGRKRDFWKAPHSLSLLFNEKASQDAAFSDVSLDDQANTPPNQQEHLTSVAGIEAVVLKDAVRSSHLYQVCYENLTDETFRHYIAARRIKSAETALAEMAISKFWQEDYPTAASYFNHLATFYGDNDWKILEGSMLELFARCLNKIDRKEDYVVSLLKLLGRYAAFIQPKSSAENSKAAILDPIPAVSDHLKELFEVSQNLSRSFNVPLQDFFSLPRVGPHLVRLDETDGFQLQVHLRSLLAENIKFDSMKVRLQDTSDNQANELWLESSGPVVIKGSTTKVLVKSTTVSQSKYIVNRIELTLGNITFSHGSNTDSLSSPTYKGFTSAEDSHDEHQTFITCYPRASGLEAKISHSSFIDLGGRKSIEIELKSGSNMVKNGVVRLRPATAGLRLLISKLDILDGSLLLGDYSSSGHIEFSKFGPDASTILNIPYTVEGSQSMLAIRSEVEYETDKGKFLYLASKSVLTTLPVSVNVQDVFQNDALFSRFMISPAMMIPLRVFGCQMPECPTYSVVSSMISGEIFDIFPQQPASLVYKIAPKETNKQGNSARSLGLTVDFTCLNEECLAALETRFVEDIQKSNFAQLRCLLVPHLLSTFSSQWTANALEKIGLLRQIDLFPFEKMQWPTVTSALDPALEKKVIGWLQNWHKDNPTLQLQDKPPSRVVRRVRIPVDVPEIQVVHTAELLIHNTSAEESHFPVGEPINTELVLRHTRRWCPKERQEPQGDLEFMYEIIAHPETWLVGGRRRGNFTAKEGETKTFPIMLIPLVAGKLLLPNVEVKSFVSQEKQREFMQPVSRRQIQSEVDYRNHSMTLLVTNNFKKTTVFFDKVSESAGAWLVDSEPRIVPAGRT